MKILISFLLALNMFSHDETQIIKGQVTLITSANIYVRFDNTDLMKIGDRLFLSGQKTACLKIIGKSSASCVCNSLNNCSIKKGDVVLFLAPANRKKPSIVQKNIKKDEEEDYEIPIDSLYKLEKLPKRVNYKEDIRGRLSMANYSLFSKDRDDRHYIISRLSMDAEHIRDSRLSFETYMNYRTILFQNSETKSKPFARVYDLSFSYDVTPDLKISLGRRINFRTPSVGAIDGLQVEQHLGKKQFVGAFYGFRPDVIDYSFNPNMMEYGGYVGIENRGKKNPTQMTIGFIEQRNSSQIDRRYSYLQHSGTLFKNVNLFSSLELDLYNLVNDSLLAKPRVANLYLAASYRVNKLFNFMLSYDSRKRVLYYETFQDDIERLLNDDIARQGVRFRINFRPINTLVTGVSYAKRFQNDMQNKSDNINGFVTLTQIPNIGGRLSLSYNINVSNYLESTILSIKHSRYLIKDKLYSDFYYRFVHYNYLISNNSLGQNYLGTFLSYNINKKLVFSLTGEVSFFNQEKIYRINVRLLQRLYKRSR
ncbi:MAG: hypothetical protein KDD99_02755 [Bacteroidetes bacterium]|nr:hypothetical protein [Bacteroidota bacterium]